MYAILVHVDGRMCPSLPLTELLEVLLCIIPRAISLPKCLLPTLHPNLKQLLLCPVHMLVYQIPLPTHLQVPYLVLSARSPGFIIEINFSWLIQMLYLVTIPLHLVTQSPLPLKVIIHHGSPARTPRLTQVFFRCC